MNVFDCNPLKYRKFCSLAANKKLSCDKSFVLVLEKYKRAPVLPVTGNTTQIPSEILQNKIKITCKIYQNSLSLSIHKYRPVFPLYRWVLENTVSGEIPKILVKKKITRGRLLAKLIGADDEANLRAMEVTEN